MLHLRFARQVAGTLCSTKHASQAPNAYRVETRRQGRVRAAASAAAGAAGQQRATGPLRRAGGQAVCRAADRSEKVSTAKAMEVEVKIRLPDRAAYDRIAAILAPGKKASHAQENYFFDGDKQELESQRAVLRLRFYDGNAKAVITVKGKQILHDGIGRASEVEEDVPDAAAARAWLTAPNSLLAASPLLQSLNSKIGITQLLCMGGFKNQRDVFDWEGEALELDETDFAHGTLYEIECETSQPEVIRAKLEALLQQHGIAYSYSKTSKFANFINKSLL